MRTIAVLLLLANAGLAGWAWNQRLEAHLAARVPPLPAAVPPLVLLAEQPQPRRIEIPESSSAPVAELAISVTNTNPPAAASGVCLSIGPFADSTASQGLREWLASYAVKILEDTRHEPGRQRFWIYLEPDSTEQARAQFADLQARGVQDIQLIRRGGLGINTISLGLYSSQDAVNRRLSELAEQGYRPVVVPQGGSTTQHWLQAEMALGHEDPGTMPADLLRGATVRTLACNTLPAAGTAHR